MEYSQKQQSGTSSGPTKNGNGGNRLSMTGLVLGIIATLFVKILLTKFTAATSSRQSTPSEIAAFAFK